MASSLAFSPSETSPALPADLQELAGMWDRLPEAVRSGIIATARAVASATGGAKP